MLTTTNRRLFTAVAVVGLFGAACSNGATQSGSAAAAPSDGAATTVRDGQAPAPAGPAPTAKELAGTWTVKPGSEAGYAVTETFAGQPSPVQARGKTQDVTGTVEAREAGTDVQIHKADVTVKVINLTSDSSRRDNRIKTLGLESEKFPEAKFELTQPITVAPTGGTVQATGKWTVHGQSKDHTMPLEVKIDSATSASLTGNTTFKFSDFGMEVPSIAGFVSVQDTAGVEIKILLGK